MKLVSGILGVVKSDKFRSGCATFRKVIPIRLKELMKCCLLKKSCQGSQDLDMALADLYLMYVLKVINVSIAINKFNTLNFVVLRLLLL